MSTRGTIAYWAIGSRRWRCEFGWHLYEECRDGCQYLELTLFGYDVLNVRIRGPRARGPKPG